MRRIAGCTLPLTTMTLSFCRCEDGVRDTSTRPRLRRACDARDSPVPVAPGGLRRVQAGRKELAHAYFHVETDALWFFFALRSYRATVFVSTLGVTLAARRGIICVT